MMTMIFHQSKVWDVYAVFDGEDVILRDQDDRTKALRVPLTELSAGAVRNLRAAGWVR